MERNIIRMIFAGKIYIYEIRHRDIRADSYEMLEKPHEKHKRNMIFRRYETIRYVRYYLKRLRQGERLEMRTLIENLFPKRSEYDEKQEIRGVYAVYQRIRNADSTQKISGLRSRAEIRGKILHKHEEHRQKEFLMF